MLLSEVSVRICTWPAWALMLTRGLSDAARCRSPAGRPVRQRERPPAQDAEDGGLAPTAGSDSGTLCSSPAEVLHGARPLLRGPW